MSIYIYTQTHTSKRASVTRKPHFFREVLFVNYRRGIRL